jgi:hypothetical protein
MPDMTLAIGQLRRWLGTAKTFSTAAMILMYLGGGLGWLAQIFIDKKPGYSIEILFGIAGLMMILFFDFYLLQCTLYEIVSLQELYEKLRSAGVDRTVVFDRKDQNTILRLLDLPFTCWNDVGYEWAYFQNQRKKPVLFLFTWPGIYLSAAAAMILWLFHQTRPSILFVILIGFISGATLLTVMINHRLHSGAESCREDIRRKLAELYANSAEIKAKLRNRFDQNEKQLKAFEDWIGG